MGGGERECVEEDVRCLCWGVGGGRVETEGVVEGGDGEEGGEVGGECGRVGDGGLGGGGGDVV